MASGNQRTKHFGQNKRSEKKQGKTIFSFLGHILSECNKTEICWNCGLKGQDELHDPEETDYRPTGDRGQTGNDVGNVGHVVYP